MQGGFARAIAAVDHDVLLCLYGTTRYIFLNNCKLRLMVETST